MAAKKCPVGALLKEHETWRTFVGALAEAIDTYAKGNAEAKDALSKSLRVPIAAVSCGP